MDNDYRRIINHYNNMTTIEFTKEELPKLKELFPEKFKSEYPYEKGKFLHYRDEDARCFKRRWNGDGREIELHKLGLIFKTSESLEEDNKLRSAIQRVKDYIRMNDIEVGEFFNNSMNYYIGYDHDDKELFHTFASFCSSYNPLGKDHWIKKEADAEKVKEACGDDLIIIYS